MREPLKGVWEHAPPLKIFATSTPRNAIYSNLSIKFLEIPWPHEEFFYISDKNNEAWYKNRKILFTIVNFYCFAECQNSPECLV